MKNSSITIRIDKKFKKKLIKSAKNKNLNLSSYILSFLPTNTCLQCSNITKNNKFCSYECRDLFKRTYNEIGEKRCTSCDDYFNINKFSKDKSRKDGLNNKCKKCVLQKRKQRRENDSLFKLKSYLSTRVSTSLSNRGWTKTSKTKELIGCSYKELESYLEGLFTENMTWENYGEWHVDHKIPLASAKTEQEIIKLFHYSNLQPLWAQDNLEKGAKIL